MKLSIQNLARIHKADITIDGITVVAGYNSTGKSTISKALVCCMKPYGSMQNMIKNQRIFNIMRALEDIGMHALPNTLYLNRNNDALRQLAKKIIEDSSVKLDTQVLISPFIESLSPDEQESMANYIQENIDKIREDLKKKKEVTDQEYAVFIVNQQFRETFDQQINTLGCSEPALIDFIDKETIHIKVVNNRVSECPVLTLNQPAPFYIEPVHMLDQSSMHLLFRKNRSIYQALLPDEAPSIKSMTMDEYSQREHALQIVTDLANTVMHGRLRPSDDTVLFYDDDFKENISVKNLASGIKSMALIARLLENGKLKPKGLLIIDEPEVNLHPEWQLSFASFLVQLNKELGIQILLTTHSPYFLRALEVYSREFDVFDSLKLYLTTPCKEEGLSHLFTVEDMTHDSNSIFKQLYLPLEKL